MTSVQQTLIAHVVIPVYVLPYRPLGTLHGTCNVSVGVTGIVKADYLTFHQCPSVTRHTSGLHTAGQCFRMLRSRMSAARTKEFARIASPIAGRAGRIPTPRSFSIGVVRNDSDLSSACTVPGTLLANTGPVANGDEMCYYMILYFFQCKRKEFNF